MGHLSCLLGIILNYERNNHKIVFLFKTSSCIMSLRSDTMAFMEIQMKSNMLDMNTTVAVIYPEHIEKQKKLRSYIYYMDTQDIIWTG